MIWFSHKFLSLGQFALKLLNADLLKVFFLYLRGKHKVLFSESPERREKPFPLPRPGAGMCVKGIRYDSSSEVLLLRGEDCTATPQAVVTFPPGF